MIRTSRYLLLVLALMCTGCVVYNPHDGHPDMKNMIVISDNPIHQSPATVGVSVPYEWDFVHPTLRADFAEALRRSIVVSGLFADVLRDRPANFQLQARITRVYETHPVPSFLFTGTWRQVDPDAYTGTWWMEVDYLLSRNESTQVVWRKTITSGSITEKGDSPLLEERRAAYRAARNNIEQAIQDISQLRLE